jgi:hydroxymethylbilane synthase
LKLRIAARTSRLSLRQVEIAVNHLARRLATSIEYEIVGVKTRGDVHRDKPLHEIGGVGLFEKEVNRAVLEGAADIAIHSLKDLPSKLPDGLEIVYAPPRGAREDSLVPRRGLPALAPHKLPKGTLVAAGSPRRRGMILHSNRGVNTTWIRGNIDTRLHRLDEGRADYLVAAETALRRLGINRPRIVLDPNVYVPTPGQGIIAVVAQSDTSLARKLRAAADRRTMKELLAEREFLSAYRYGCGAPVGATAYSLDSLVKVIAANYSLDLEKPVIVEYTSRDPIEAGREAAKLLLGAEG